MALLDFEVPSGYVYQSWNYVSKKVTWLMYDIQVITYVLLLLRICLHILHGQQPSISVQRTDKTGNGALLYIDEVFYSYVAITSIFTLHIDKWKPRMH